jgi:hypothetical protein
MRYLGIAYEEERTLNALTEREWHALRQETLDYVATLERSGRLILAQPLQSASRAATLRVRNGKLSVTDGPFAETKEQIGGFFLFEAASFQEALDVAAKWPSARLGSIEVRPIDDGLRMDRRYGAPD